MSIHHTYKSYYTYTLHYIGPLLHAIREVIPIDMPIHFHTHATSSAAISTCLTMAASGCDIIDLCTASMADGYALYSVWRILIYYTYV